MTEQIEFEPQPEDHAPPPGSNPGDASASAEQSQDEWKGPDDPIIADKLEGRSPPPPDLDEFEDKLRRLALTDMAEQDNDDYAKEREDQEALKRNDPAFNSPDRLQERAKRYQRLFDRVEQARKETADALGQSDEVEARVKSERVRAKAEVRIEQYDRENPGYVDFVKETIATYGDLTDAAGAVIAESPRAPEIIDRICQNPEFIEILNQLPPRELDMFVARTEGMIEGIGHNAPAPQKPLPKARTISQAPKPVQTVSGKSHAASKSLEDMSYDEYKRARMAGAG